MEKTDEKCKNTLKQQGFLSLREKLSFGLCLNYGIII